MSKRKTTGTKTRREQLREKRRRDRQRRQLTLIAIVGGVAILVAAVLIYPSFRPIGDIAIPPAREHPNPNGRGMGDPNAPVTLEEFSDFQCPACRQWAETISPDLIENYVKTGQVYFTYHHFPFIDDRVAGSESDQASNASMCAAEQNRFWDYHDILFANQTGENIGAYSDRRLVAFAEELGLDMNEFNACFSSNRYREEITADLNRARTLALSGTPSILLNGQLVDGISYAAIQQQIDALLTVSQ